MGSLHGAKSLLKLHIKSLGRKCRSHVTLYTTDLLIFDYISHSLPLFLSLLCAPFTRYYSSSINKCTWSKFFLQASDPNRMFLLEL